MKALLRALQPTRIGVQIPIVIFISLLAVHAILTASLLLRSSEREAPPHGHPSQIEAMVVLLDATARGEREHLLASINAALPVLDMRRQPASDFDWMAPRGHRFGHLQERGFEVASGGAPAEARVAVRLRDGDVVSARVPPPPPWRPFDPLGVTVLAMAIIVILLGVWAARGVTAPLRSFASAAETFTPEAVVSPLPERGPEEVRTAARAFNRMRARIKSLVDDRTRTLIAVGHDLRTPLTRLRLSSEFVSDEALRGQMLRDIDQMKAMVESILHVMRRGRSQQDARMIDAASSVQTICDQFVDMGHAVHLRRCERATLRAHADEFQRLVTNLIDNAVRYAGGAEVSLVQAGGKVVILVEDDGPGIPQASKAGVLLPFVRGETAAVRAGDNGLGLGLSIAHEIATAQGGTLTLLDRAPRGLTVRVELPAAVSRDQELAGAA